MVNAFSDLAYRSDTGFSHDFSDASGFYDRSEYQNLSPVTTTGRFPMINSSNLTKTATSKLQRISGVAARGRAFHAGVARSLSLYRHQSQSSSSEVDLLSLFRVDIEKSAPRTTDPVALADTNNPTMNNSACTICHQRLDPVAGAYQSFGDSGTI
jgi:hypothetical protein